MKASKIRRGFVAAAVAGLGLGAASADGAVIVLDDYDTNRPLPLASNSGGGSTAVVDSPDADADNELQKVTGTSANFLQYVKSNGLARTGAVTSALLNGDRIQLRVLAFDADLTQNLTVRLVVNTNAWSDFNGSNGYRGVAQVSVNDGADRDLQLAFDYTPASAFYSALQAYSAGAGTFFEFFLDNSGFPGVASAQTLYFDDFGVRQVPEPASLALLGAGALVLARRRA